MIDLTSRKKKQYALENSIRISKRFPLSCQIQHRRRRNTWRPAMSHRDDSKVRQASLLDDELALDGKKTTRVFLLLLLLTTIRHLS